MTPRSSVRRDVYERLGGFDRRLSAARTGRCGCGSPPLPDLVRAGAAGPLPHARRFEHRAARPNGGRHAVYAAMPSRSSRRICHPTSRRARRRRRAETYALTALRTADRRCCAHDPPAAAAQIKEAIRLRRSPKHHTPSCAPAVRVALTIDRRCRGHLGDRGGRHTDDLPWTPPSDRTRHVEAARRRLVGCGAVTRRVLSPALSALARKGVAGRARAVRSRPGVRAPLRLRFPGAARVDVTGSLPAVPGPGDRRLAPDLPRRADARCPSPRGSPFCARSRGVTLAEAVRRWWRPRGGRASSRRSLPRAFPATETSGTASGRRPGRAPAFQLLRGRPVRLADAVAELLRQAGLGCGVLLDIGPHLLDLFVWWWGRRSRRLRGRRDGRGRGELPAASRLRGFSGEVRLSRDWRAPNRYASREPGDGRLEVNEADSSCSASRGRRTPRCATARRAGRSTGCRGRTAAPNFDQSFLAQLRGVVAAARGGWRRSSPAAEALASLRLIEDCYRRRSSMAMPWLARAGRRALADSAKGMIVAYRRLRGRRLHRQPHGRDAASEGAAEVRAVVGRAAGLARSARFALDGDDRRRARCAGNARAFRGCDAVVHAVAGDAAGNPR